MTMVKVIVQGSFGVFEPSVEFETLIVSKGHQGLWSIEARTDADLIRYVEENGELHNGLTFIKGKESYMYVQVVEVDTSKQWMITEYDGSEGIKYIDIEVIDEKLNYVRLKG